MSTTSDANTSDANTSDANTIKKPNIEEETKYIIYALQTVITFMVLCLYYNIYINIYNSIYINI